MISKNNRIVCLGKITKTHGLKGAVFIISFGEMIFAWPQNSSIGLYNSLSPENGFLVKADFLKDIYISNLFQKKNNVVSNIQEYETKEQAEQLVGKYLGSPLLVLQKKYDYQKELYLFHYIDLKVQDAKSQEIIGYTTQIITNSTQDLLVIWHEKLQKEILVPLLSPYIQETHIDKKIVIVSAIESLT